MSHQHTKANLILLLEAYHRRKSKTEEVPGWNPEELHKKSFQKFVFSFYPEYLVTKLGPKPLNTSF